MNLKKINKDLDRMLEAELMEVYPKEQFIADLQKDFKTMQTALTSLNNESIDIKDPLNMIKKLLTSIIKNIQKFEK